MNNMYTYKAFVTKVYDGDTITVDIDLGFGVWLKNQTIRLLGINTPEIRGEERPDGLITRNVLSEWISNKEVIISTEKDSKGKYGRWLGEIYPSGQFMCNDLDGIESYNQRLLNEGYAEPYES